MIHIFHHCDNDGITSSFIIQYAIEQSMLTISSTEEIRNYSINYNYHVPFDKIKAGDYVFLLDVAFDNDGMISLYEKLGDKFIWIDHHESILTNYKKENTIIAGLRKFDSVAACGLCLHYLIDNGVKVKKLFGADVLQAISYVSEYDIGGLRNYSEDDTYIWYDRIEPINYALQCYDNNSVWYDVINNEISIEDLIKDGTSISSYLLKRNANLLSAYGTNCEIEDVSCYFLNQGLGGSYMFNCIADTKYDAFVCAIYNARRNIWSVSFYGTARDVDFLEKLNKYEPKGHKNACNISCKNVKVIDKKLILEI